VDLLGTANIIEAVSSVASNGTSLVCIASMAGHFLSLSPDLEHHLATAPLSRLLHHKELDLDCEDGNVAYTVSKRANILRVQGAAKAWGDRNARLNSISPGVIATPLLLSQLNGPLGASPKAMVRSPH
jgi:NAD(P)-dependent dehydrogenase (short-subunit alcohol dehydrogenase family)